MAKKKTASYCSLVPSFPEEALVAFLFLSQETEPTTIYPIPQIFTTLDQVRECAEINAEDLSEQNVYLLEDIIMVLPITFAEHFPLKKEFWENPSLHFDDIDRTRAFITAAQLSEFYKLLVTPSTYTKQEWFFDATLPLLRTAPHEVVEQFMYHSDYPVNTKAKYAALYTCDRPLRFNWRTREVSALRTIRDEDQVISN